MKPKKELKKLKRRVKKLRKLTAELDLNRTTASWYFGRVDFPTYVAEMDKYLNKAAREKLAVPNQGK